VESGSIYDAAVEKRIAKTLVIGVGVTAGNAALLVSIFIFTGDKYRIRFHCHARSTRILVSRTTAAANIRTLALTHQRAVRASVLLLPADLFAA
jgi:hypothetical protein